MNKTEKRMPYIWRKYMELGGIEYLFGSSNDIVIIDDKPYTISTGWFQCNVEFYKCMTKGTSAPPVLDILPKNVNVKIMALKMMHDMLNEGTQLFVSPGFLGLYCIPIEVNDDNVETDQSIIRKRMIKQVSDEDMTDIVDLIFRLNELPKDSGPLWPFKRDNLGIILNERYFELESIITPISTIDASSIPTPSDYKRLYKTNIPPIQNYIVLFNSIEANIGLDIGNRPAAAICLLSELHDFRKIGFLKSESKENN